MDRNSFGLWILTLAVLTCLFAACDKDEVEDVSSSPALVLSTGVVVAPCEGGNYSFTCTIDDPASDGEIVCETTVAWIENLFYYSPDGTVSFVVSGNDSGPSREGYVTVSYSSSYGTLSDRVRVVQNGGTVPVLTVQPTAVTAAVGGGAYSFSYSVTNPVSGGKLTCTTNDDWISDFDYSQNGAVTFNVSANEDTSMRRGEIAVTYTYSDGAVNGQVAVIQDHLDSGTGFLGDLSDLLGTYEASGSSYYSEGVAMPTTWTLTICESPVNPTTVIIDGIVPAAVGYYTGNWNEAFVARGYLDDFGQFVVESQFTGYTVSDDYYGNMYVGYTPCTRYDEAEGLFYYNTVSCPPCTFSYNHSDESWTSDYGMFLALFRTYGSFSSIFSFLDVTVPTVTIRKVSNGTNALSWNETRAEGNLQLNFDFVSE
ncbi:MAG: hypothetical protein LUD72_01210 [Bacteroidales bacterium]|nr:hypothetical protein [Bacteroidales bacterium]